MNTHITFVLDSSGSMASIEDDTIGGFNSFLEDQQRESGQATVTLVDFNTTVDLVYQNRSIDDAPTLSEDTYRPGGQTALHDAIATAITSTEMHVSSTGHAESPDNVIVVVLTDGKENASETSANHVREQVAEKREEWGWEFLFIGANQDAALAAKSMNMNPDQALSMSQNSEGTQAAYESTSERISQARQSGEAGSFDETDRERQESSKQR